MCGASAVTLYGLMPERLGENQTLDREGKDSSPKIKSVKLVEIRKTRPTPCGRMMRCRSVEMVGLRPPEPRSQMSVLEDTWEAKRSPREM